MSSLNIFQTPIAKCVAAIADAIEKHGQVAVAIDADGNMHLGPANSEAMKVYEANHPHLHVSRYTRAIHTYDLQADIANRIGELSTYGQDRARKR